MVFPSEGNVKIITNIDNNISNIQQQFFQKKKSVEHPRDLKIWKLVRLGWNQQEVAGLFEMDRTNVSYIVKNIDNNIIHIQQLQREISSFLKLVITPCGESRRILD